MARVIVLWEDQLAAGSRTFGPHELAVACVADALGTATRWELRTSFHPVLCKGAGNVKRRLAEDVGRFTRDGSRLVAVFDKDRVGELYDMTNDSCKSVLRETIEPVVARVVFLEDNVETLVSTAANLLSRPPPRKNPNERDRILMNLADASTRQLRDSLCAAVPSFQYLVRLLTGWHGVL